MFDVGFAELFLLAVVGLLVLGPERLPGVARTLGSFIRKARMSWINLRNTIESEMNEADLSKPIRKAGDDLKQIGRELSENPAFKTDARKAAPTVTDDGPADGQTPAPPEAADSGKSDNA